MPLSLGGTGTRYLGDRERDTGGTYVTTLWITVLGIPILPLSSWRVYPLDQQHSIGDFSEQTFHVTRTPMNWRQVVNVYAVAACILGLLALAWQRYVAVTGQGG